MAAETFGVTRAQGGGVVSFHAVNIDGPDGAGNVDAAVRCVAGSSPSVNGNGWHFDNGSIGDVVILCADPGLAPEMRRLKLRAVCDLRESDHAKEMCERRAVIVAYRGANNLPYALQLVEHARARYHPERIGSLDLAAEMGFEGEPESFVDWFIDAIEAERYLHGPDLLARARAPNEMENESALRRSPMARASPLGTQTTNLASST